MIAKTAEAAAYGTAHERDAELGGGFGIDVLEPVDEAGVCADGDPHRDDRCERRVGFGNENVAAADERACASPHRGIVGGIVEAAAEERGASEAGGGDAMDMDAVHRRLFRQRCARAIVELSAGDDVHVFAARGQVKSEIAENLTGGGMIGVEKAIQE